MQMRLKPTRIGFLPILAVLILAAAFPAAAGTFYLDPDTTLITSGVGTQ